MTPAQTSVLLWLSRQPEGARAPDIARGSKTSGDNVRRVLASLKRDGLVTFSGPPRSNVGRWCVIERLAATTAAVDEARRRGKAEIRRRQDANRKRRIAEGREPEADKPFLHRVVAADKAKPMPKRGPASVWDLA